VVANSETLMTGASHGHNFWTERFKRYDTVQPLRIFSHLRRNSIGVGGSTEERFALGKLLGRRELDLAIIVSPIMSTIRSRFPPFDHCLSSTGSSSILAARIKSFSVRPFAACVQISIATFRYSTTCRSG
jgi:hypothetical protein